MHKIAITGTGSLIGQAIIKGIKSSRFQKNIELIGLDYFIDTVGSFFVQKNFLLPDILSDKVSEKKWIEEIISILISNSVEIVFIGVDFELKLFSKYKKKIELNTKAKIIVSNLQSIEIANDKFLTYKFLKNNNFHYPQTELLSDVNIKDIEYPKIIKPRIGYRSNNVNVVSKPKEIDRLNIKNPKDYILQEYLRNNDQEYTCGTLSINDQIETIILKRYLKEGNTYLTYHKKEYYGVIDKYIMSINKKLKTFGACNYQLRIDDSGNPKLFEINLRHSGTTYFRALYGFNEIEFIIGHVLFNQKTKTKLKYGRAIRYFEEMLIQ